MYNIYIYIYTYIYIYIYMRRLHARDLPAKELPGEILDLSEGSALTTNY